MNEREQHGYFVGRISPFLLSEFEYHSLDEVVSTFDGKQRLNKSNPAAEVCLIGLVAHFEAFCKHLFAASANLNVSALRRFANRRPELALRLQDVLSISESPDYGYGFLVADHLDFGAPEKVNGLFRDLLDITPLSKDDIAKYAGILRQRHLMVHHAGIFTLEYCRSAAGSAVRPYVDAVRLNHEDYVRAADFLFELALKMTRSVADALRASATDEEASDEARQAAIAALLTGVYDTLE